MPRFFTQQISKADLKIKILQAWKHNPDYSASEDIREEPYLATLTPIIEKDLTKINFDCENISAKNGFGQTSLVSLQSLPNGLTFLGVTAGGDWEQPLFFIIYWDGSQLRGYIPEDGNPFNTQTKEAYGNSDTDEANAQTRGWADVDSADFDDSKMVADITQRIQYNGSTPIQALASTIPKVKKKKPISANQLGNALATMNKRIAQTQVPKKTSRNQPSNPPMSGIAMAIPTDPHAICSRCGHVFKQDKPILECPQCGLTVGIEVDDEIEWTEEMKEPIPDYVYNTQSPEEIFFKTIQWYYQKWIAKLKGNPSSRLK